MLEILTRRSEVNSSQGLPRKASWRRLTTLLHGRFPLCLLTQRSVAFSSSFSLIMLEQLDHGASTGLVHVENQGKAHVGASRVAPLVATGRRLRSH